MLKCAKNRERGAGLSRVIFVRSLFSGVSGHSRAVVGVAGGSFSAAHIAVGSSSEAAARMMETVRKGVLEIPAQRRPHLVIRHRLQARIISAYRQIHRE